jgi:hypothetical protein
MNYSTLRPSGNATAGTGTPTIQQLEAEATARARQNRGQLTPGVYVDNPNVKMTPERAFAGALEANPEVYERFRAQHNAAPMVAALRAAGVAIRGV